MLKGEDRVARHEVVPRNPDTKFCRGQSWLGFGADRLGPSSPSVSESELGDDALLQIALPLCRTFNGILCGPTGLDKTPNRS